MAKKKKQKRANRKPPGRCMFCGGPGLTKEHHLWPVWLGKHVEHTKQFHSRRSETFIGERTVSRDFQNRQGPLVSRTARVVCVKCNHGWMGDIEQAAKPILLPLIRGESHDLTPASQHTVATWLTLRMMVAEQREPQKMVPPAQHHWFYEHKIPLPNWLTYIGYYEGQEWLTRYFRTHLYRSFTPLSPVVGIGVPITHYYQSSTFVSGNFFTHTISGTDDYHRGFAVSGKAAPALHLINPVTVSPIRWPSTPTITDKDAMTIHMAFYNSFREQWRPSR